MKKVGAHFLAVLFFLGLAGIADAQNQQDVPASDVVTKSIKAIGYTVGNTTSIPLVGTRNATQASGEAKVQAKASGSLIELKVLGLPQPATLGPEFLTYVLWRITPDGNTTKLGEVRIDKDGNGTLETKTTSQTFALAVTAEPYFAVQIPSEEVILVNEPSKKTKGKLYPENSYKLMTLRQYQKQANPLGMTLDLKNVPLDVYQARNAVEIAKARGAQEYAPDIFHKAEGSQRMMEQQIASKADKKQITTTARQTVQFAEDSRALSAQKQEEARIQKEKDDAAAAAAATANAQAATEAKRQADLTAAKEAQMRADAAAAAAQSKAKEDAARADAQRAKAATEALRAQLLSQLNAVLQTTDTQRGLVVNMADVLFDLGKFSLSEDAKLKLARLSGVILSHPGLNLAIEGYTDSTGSEDFNLKLSQQRAEAVRSFLVSQGLSPDAVTAAGLGEDRPVADNTTAAGRQQNRRVEIIVSGDVIGTKIQK
jgi:outer membrane protein OmpA-like peptidoglycan-associated protein